MSSEATAPPASMPIVAIAASAGGLKQISALLRGLPADKGRARGMRVATRLAAETALANAQGYAVRIEQVVVNVINNALDTIADNEKDG